MLKKILLTTALTVGAAVALSAEARAGSPWTFTDNWASRAAATYPWHGNHYHIQYGAPIALVVPPTAHMRTQYSWGASQNLMYPIHHQFERNASGPGYGGLSGFRPKPPWPSHTDQFGVYYVRGPW
jgi:hypothetical protein